MAAEASAARREGSAQAAHRAGALVEEEKALPSPGVAAMSPTAPHTAACSQPLLPLGVPPAVPCARLSPSLAAARMLHRRGSSGCDARPAATPALASPAPPSSIEGSAATAAVATSQRESAGAGEPRASTRPPAQAWSRPSSESSAGAAVASATARSDAGTESSSLADSAPVPPTAGGAAACAHRRRGARAERNDCLRALPWSSAHILPSHRQTHLREHEPERRP